MCSLNNYNQISSSLSFDVFLIAGFFPALFWFDCDFVSVTPGVKLYLCENCSSFIFFKILYFLINS